MHYAFGSLFVFLLLLIKHIEGRLIYKIHVNNENCSVSFRTSFGYKTIRSDEVKKWGLEYISWHNPIVPEGNQSVNLKIITISGPFIYPVKVYDHYLFESDKETQISKIWKKKPIKFIDTTSSGLVRITKTAFFNLSFLWL